MAKNVLQKKLSSNKFKAMKKFAYITLAFSFLLFTDCRREKSWIVKRRLLYSCDNPIPVVGHPLFIRSSYSVSNPIIETDHEGKFSLPYELDYRQLEYLELQSHFYLKPYVIGIPKKENINVGDVYLYDNYFFVINVIVEKTTSNKDTIFYDYNAHTGYGKFVVGPFENNQAIDTIAIGATKIHDLDYYSKKSDKRSLFYLGRYMFNQTKVYPYINEDQELIECMKYINVPIKLDDI